MIGSVGVWIFNITIFVLSLVLIFEDRFTDIIKNCFIGSRDESSQDEIRDDFASDTDAAQIGGLARHSSAQGLRGAENFNALDNSLSAEEDSAKQGNFAEQGASGRGFEGEQNFQNLNDAHESEPEQNFSDAHGLQASAERELKMPQKGRPSRLKRVERLSEVAENKRLLDQLDKGRVAKPKDFKLPPLDFLNPPPKKKSSIDESEIDRKIYDLLDKLRKFKIDGDVVRTYSGPVVTTFEFRPAAHIKVSKILTLQDDLAMALRAQTIRIQAPVPGKDVVGIEIPNQNIDTIYLREILESDVFKSASSPLTIVLGKDIVGQPFVTDLKKLPHLLIAGTTGSGKSVGINAMLLSLLYRNSPKSLRLIMIDPKMLEFSIYNDIPHLLTPVITQPKQAIIALSNLVAEMEQRYSLMAQNRTKNIDNYNEKMLREGGEILPYIVVIIDELADLMMTSGKDVEHYIARLAQSHPDTLFVLPAHRNPRVREALLPNIAGCDNVVITEPLEYGQFCTLMNRADVVLTDSGGVQEEAPALSKPVLVMRENTERPEAIAFGVARLVGTDEERIVTEVSRLLDDAEAYGAMARAANPYGDGRAAARILAALAAAFGRGERLPDFDPAGR